MRSYLYGLAEYLRCIDTAPLSPTPSSSLSSALPSSSLTSALPSSSLSSASLSSLTSSQAASKRELKALIIKSSDIVRELSDKLAEGYDERYVASSDFGSYEELTSRRIDRASSSASEIYENLRALASSVSYLAGHTESGGEFLSVISSGAYLKTGLLGETPDCIPVYGLEIGQRTVADGDEVFEKYARFTPDRISFFDRAGNEIAYIGDSALNIGSASVRDSLSLGGFTLSFTDGMTLRWTGERNAI